MSEKVYLLGAGSSSELKFRMSTWDPYAMPRITDALRKGPLSSGFFYYAHQFASVVKGHEKYYIGQKTPEELLTYCCREYLPKAKGIEVSPEELLNNEDVSRYVNIEKLYAHLIKKSSAKSAQEAYLIPVLKKYIVEALSYVSYFCVSQYHMLLVRHLAKGTVIISFNWDHLLDDALHESGRWRYETGYGISFRSVAHKSYKAYERNTTPSEILLLKPHGSINWYTDNLYSEGELDEAVDLIIPEERKFRGGTLGTSRLGYIEKVGERFLRTKLCPPGDDKFIISGLREKIRESLESAGELIAIGFSFNEQDRAVKSELAAFRFREDLLVNLIDPNADQLRPVYEEVFRTKLVRSSHRTFGDYVNSLAL